MPGFFFCPFSNITFSSFLNRQNIKNLDYAIVKFYFNMRNEFRVDFVNSSIFIESIWTYHLLLNFRPFSLSNDIALTLNYRDIISHDSIVGLFSGQ